MVAWKAAYSVLWLKILELDCCLLILSRSDRYETGLPACSARAESTLRGRINNSTLNGNVAYSHYNYSEGGGIATSGIVTISNSTLSGNSALRGGGIFGGAVLQNSIVANNGGGNCYRTTSSRGYNLSSDNTCNFSGPGDLNNHDPLLGLLQNNGGPTETMALLPGSPAIGGGNPAGCTDAAGSLLKTDQRGMPRPDREDTLGCDMGAFESQSD